MMNQEEALNVQIEELKKNYHNIITLLGEDVDREGLLKTNRKKLL